MLLDQEERAARRALWSFFCSAERRRDDLLLFYFSGHGVKDDHGQLHLAFRDTEIDLLRATALPATELRDAMDQSRSRRQVVVLDCCHSGAFERGAKAVAGESVGTHALFGDVRGFESEGEGRITLTATDATQFAWEGRSLTGEAERSIFTRCLVDGLQSGKADRDGDGWVGVDELYDYVYGEVVSQTPRQRPGKFGAVQGEFIVARRRPGSEEAVPLPLDVAADMDSPHRATREAAVAFLGGWLHGRHIGRRLAAHTALERVASADDSIRVRQLARDTLDRPPRTSWKGLKSDDRRNVWDGSAWRELSDDGWYYWDGTAWVEVSLLERG